MSRSDGGGRVLGLALAAVLTAACHGPSRSRGARTPEPFVVAPAHAAAGAEVDRLAALAAGDARARTVRLARLLDLFDAARMGDDADARDVLWAALGGHAQGRGPEATRDALAQLLELALALEDAPLDDDARAVVSDAIALLSTDLQPPADAEGLATRTLAYRAVAEQGHPQLQDNARWRLFDHVAGTLAAAIAAPLPRRIEIAVQVGYVEREDLAPELADDAPQHHPRWPGAAPLVAVLQHQREALLAQEQWATIWSGVLERRAAKDRALADSAMAALPASRAAAPWAAMRPAGTGQRESLGPIVRVSGGQLLVDDGRPGARRLALASDDVTEAADAVQAALVADGRGVLLFAPDRDTPPAQLRLALRALRRGAASRIELALGEPHDDGGAVVVAVPLELVRPGDRGATATAIAAARIELELGPGGARAIVDGERVPTPARTPAELATLLALLTRALPRERTVRLSLLPELGYEALLDAAIALGGGARPRFAVIGWIGDDGSARGGGSGGATTSWRLQRRAQWAGLSQVAIDQPFTLVGDDQARLAAFAQMLPRCLPELAQGERAPRRPTPATPALPPVRVAITMESGRVTAIEPRPVPGVAAAGLAALQTCVQDEAWSLRLREHADRMAIELVATQPGAAITAPDSDTSTPTRP